MTEILLQVQHSTSRHHCKVCVYTYVCRCTIKHLETSTTLGTGFALQCTTRYIYILLQVQVHRNTANKVHY